MKSSIATAYVWVVWVYKHTDKEKCLASRQLVLRVCYYLVLCAGQSIHLKSIACIVKGK